VKAFHGPCIDSQNALSWRDSLQLRLGRLNWECARANAGVVSLLLLGVEGAETMHDHRALDGETERVLGRERNVWPELITVGTVMRRWCRTWGVG